MLKQYFAVLLTFLCVGTAAQNNLIVLSEKGHLFTLFVNDVQINDSVQSLVTAKNILADTCLIKMQFADKKNSDFSAKIFLTENAKRVSKKEFTYSLIEEKGKRKLKFISIDEQESDTLRQPQEPEVKIEKIFTDLEKQKQAQNRLNEIYPAPANCTNVISDSLFQFNLKLLRDNHIEMNRMKDAKWFVSNNCINTKQLIKVMGVFDRRESKVKIAEFAFAYMEDHRNFLETLSAVPYDSEKEELKKFYHKHIEK